MQKMAELTTIDSLLEMGFDRNRAEKAVANTGNQGIEQAMDWLMEHESDPNIDEPYLPPVENVVLPPVENVVGEGAADSQSSTSVPTIADLTEVSDILMETASEEDIQNAIDETNKRPMTEEEKREQVKRLEELMRMKQAERRERERAEEVEREKLRRRQGQEMQQIRQKLQDDDMRKLTDQRRKEKMEDKLARQRVKDKIARDREERAQKFGMPMPTQPTQPSPSSPTSQGPPPIKKEYDESRIQVRLFDGAAITAVFKAQEPLAAVRVYVQMNSNIPEGQDFTMMSPYPHHIYTELDMEKPLKELGLVPSAVLVVTKK